MLKVSGSGVKVYRGESLRLVVPLRRHGFPYTPPAGASLLFTAKIDREDADDESVFQKALGAGVTVSGNLATVEILSVDTKEVTQDLLQCGIVVGEPDDDVIVAADFRLELRTSPSSEVVSSVDIITTEPPFPFGLPTGGLEGQFLSKASGIDYDFLWADGVGGSADVPWVSITSYGAVEGVGKSEGQRSLNTAAFVAACATGKNVLIPLGHWEINNLVEHECSGQTIFGVSTTRSIVWQTNAAYGHFRFKANNAELYPNNPPGGSPGMSHYVGYEKFFMGCTSSNANAGISHSMPDPVTGLYPSGLTWLEDNLRIRDMWIEGYDAPGGRGVDLFSCAKIFVERVLTKNCDIGFKSWGGSSNCQQWSISFHKVRIGFLGMGISGSSITISDTASSGTASQVYFRLIDCQVEIKCGEIEFNSLTDDKNSRFLDAEGGRISLKFNRLLQATGLTSIPILARAVRSENYGSATIGQSVFTHVHIENVSRTGHLAGTPMALSGGNTAFITGLNHADFIASNFGSTVHDNATQQLSWSNGVKQVETITCLGTVSASGNGSATVTSNEMFGTTRVVPFAVLSGDTPTDWAPKLRAALLADERVRSVFTIGGTGAVVTLTSTVAVANDSTANLAVSTGTASGITTIASSVNTTAGVAGEIVRINAHPWFDPNSFPTPSSTMEGLSVQVPGSQVNLHPGGGVKQIFRDAAANPGTGTIYRWGYVGRQNFRVQSVTNNTGHFGHPDIIVQTNTSGAIATPLQATTSNDYRAASRGGIIVEVHNASTFTNTVVPNGTDTIDGVTGALSLVPTETARLLTFGTGAWFRLKIPVVGGSGSSSWEGLEGEPIDNEAFLEFIGDYASVIYVNAELADKANLAGGNSFVGTQNFRNTLYLGESSFGAVPTSASITLFHATGFGEMSITPEAFTTFRSMKIADADGTFAVTGRTDGKVNQASTHDLTVSSTPTFAGLKISSPGGDITISYASNLTPISLGLPDESGQLAIYETLATIYGSSDASETDAITGTGTAIQRWSALRVRQAAVAARAVAEVISYVTHTTGALTLDASNCAPKVIRYTGASAIDATPDAGQPTGRYWIIRQAGAGQVTVLAPSGGSRNGTDYKTAAQHKMLSIEHVGGDVLDFEGGVS